MKAGSAALGAFWRLEWRIRRRDTRRLLSSAMSAILVLILALLSVPLVDPAGFARSAGAAVESWPLHVVSGYVAVMVLAAAVPLLRDRLRRYQETGFLEACVMTQTPLWKTVLAMPVYDVAMELVGGSVLMLAILALTSGLPVLSSWLVATGFLLVGTATCVLLGIASASMTLAFRASDPMGSVAMGVTLAASGVLVPRALLPEPLAWLGALSPVAPMLDGVRMAFAYEGWNPALMPVIQHQLAIALVFGLLALATIRWALGRVLHEGSFAD
jgi:ABC-type polysaccharide/polyol phosphate export permease